eukprot:TRINITY_DN46191_c0_g1_i1.p1 TRINITY_DN46191_c0_g1~~TRINITY_DN46191_c0_g1_i1.p1  ORF type:complete len:479 (+),score=70.21 TRINITY_DN46191_c0_g1_i1:97-1437(+)
MAQMQRADASRRLTFRRLATAVAQENGGSVALCVCCIWLAALLTNCLKMWPVVFAVDIQTHLMLGHGEVSTLLSVPPLLASSAFLLGPSLMAQYGTRPVLAGTQLVTTSCALLAAAGYAVGSYYALTISQCLLLPSTCLTGLTCRKIIADVVGEEFYAEFAAAGTAIMAAGFMAAHFMLARLPADLGLWSLVCIAVIASVLNLVGERQGAFLVPEMQVKNCSTYVGLCADLRRRLSLASLCKFNAAYWVVCLLGSFVSGFHAFTDFAPYAFNKVHGINDDDANQMAGACSVVLIVGSPLSGWFFSHLPNSHGKLFILAATIIIAAHLIAASYFYDWVGYTEMSMHGIGLALLGAGAGGLIPTVLKDTPELITAGFAWQGLIGQIFFTAFMQLFFAVFIHTETYDNIEVTPGELFLVALGIVVLMLSLAYERIERRRQAIEYHLVES